MSVNSNYRAYNQYNNYGTNSQYGNNFPPPMQPGNGSFGMNFDNFQGHGYNGFQSQSGIFGGSQFEQNQFGQFGQGQYSPGQFGQGGPGGMAGPGGMKGHHHHHGAGGANGQQPPDPQQLFTQMDTNGDGQVTEDEFNAFTPTGPNGETLTNMPQPTTEQKATMWSRLDSDGTGSVSEEQFAADMPQGPPRGQFGGEGQFGQYGQYGQGQFDVSGNASTTGQTNDPYCNKNQYTTQ